MENFTDLSTIAHELNQQANEVFDLMYGPRIPAVRENTVLFSALDDARRRLIHAADACLRVGGS